MQEVDALWEKLACAERQRLGWLKHTKACRSAGLGESLQYKDTAKSSRVTATLPMDKLHINS
jgi:hypothetical protein